MKPSIKEKTATGIDALAEVEKATIALSLERIIQLIDTEIDEPILKDPQIAPMLAAAEDLKESKGV